MADPGILSGVNRLSGEDISLPRWLLSLDWILKSELEVLTFLIATDSFLVGVMNISSLWLKSPPSPTSFESFFPKEGL